MRVFLRLVVFFLLVGLLTASRAYAHENHPQTLPTLERNLTPRATAATYAPDIKPSALWDGRKMLDFHAIDNPKMIAAKEAKFLDDKEYVLGITVNGESRAYPTRFAAFHHVINDKFSATQSRPEAFVTVTY